MRNEDQFTFIVKPAPTPTEEELAPYRESTDEPHPSIQDLMKGKSREEMLLAQDRLKEYAKLSMEIIRRRDYEEQIDDTEEPTESGNNENTEIEDTATLDIPIESKLQSKEIYIRGKAVFIEKMNQRSLF